MSAAYKCDKCSQYRDGTPFATVSFSLSGGKPWGDGVAMGVCLDCAHEIRQSREAKDLAKERSEQNAAIRKTAR